MFIKVRGQIVKVNFGQQVKGQNSNYFISSKTIPIKNVKIDRKFPKMFLG